MRSRRFPPGCGRRGRGRAGRHTPDALANGKRVHQQVQLLEKIRGQQLTDDRDRAAQRYVAAALVPQGGHRLDEVALELLGVPPGELELLLRHDDLAGVAERLGQAGVLAAGRLALRPCAGEAVIGLAAEEDGVGHAEGRVDGGAHLLVEVREVPLIGRLHDAVERDEEACGDLPHGFSSAESSVLYVIPSDDAGRPKSSAQPRGREKPPAGRTPAALEPGERWWPDGGSASGSRGEDIARASERSPQRRGLQSSRGTREPGPSTSDWLAGRGTVRLSCGRRADRSRCPAVVSPSSCKTYR